MGILFACMFAAGLTCIVLYILEVIQGRLSIRTVWEDLTIDQWMLFIGSFLAPIGFVGLLLTR
jgi:hypothetical protein